MYPADLNLNKSSSSFSSLLNGFVSSDSALTATSLSKQRVSVSDSSGLSPPAPSFASQFPSFSPPESPSASIVFEEMAAVLTDITRVSSYDPLNDPAYVAWSFYSSCLMLVLCLFGAITNCVCGLVFLHPKMRSPVNVLIVALCAIDSTVVISAVPLLVLRGINTYLSSSLVEKVTAYSVVFLYPLAMSAKTCSVWTFVLITFERYMAVCHPLKARALFHGNRQAYMAVFGLVALSVLYNIVRFWEYELDYRENGKPMPVFLLRKDRNYYDVYYTALYLLTNFLNPFVTLIALNTRIITAIRIANTQRIQLSRKENREYRTARMLVVVILLFLVTSILPYTMNIVEAVRPQFFIDAETRLASTVLVDISNLLVILNCSTTIFVYYHFSSKFRVLLHKQYSSKRRRLSSFLPRMASAQSVESVRDLLQVGPFDHLVDFLRNVGERITRFRAGRKDTLAGAEGANCTTERVPLQRLTSRTVIEVLESSRRCSTRSSVTLASSPYPDRSYLSRTSSRHSTKTYSSTRSGPNYVNPGGNPSPHNRTPRRMSSRSLLQAFENPNNPLKHARHQSLPRSDSGVSAGSLGRIAKYIRRISNFNLRRSVTVTQRFV